MVLTGRRGRQAGRSGRTGAAAFDLDLLFGFLTSAGAAVGWTNCADEPGFSVSDFGVGAVLVSIFLPIIDIRIAGQHTFYRISHLRGGMANSHIRITRFPHMLSLQE